MRLAMLVFILALAGRSNAHADEVREPWASMAHPQDVAKRQSQVITQTNQTYTVMHGGTMDGDNCRSPVHGGFGIWDQTWESNRSVRLENLGDSDVINPWLSNGRNDFRSIQDIVESVIKPSMSDREKAIALWRFRTTHGFHASADDAVEMHDPVKTLNVYGYRTCGDEAVCLAGLWHAAGLPVSPMHLLGHRTSQVFYSGAWHFMDSNMGPVYLLRDNTTIASEQDLLHDHDLLKRSHSHGLMDPDRRTDNEISAALFYCEPKATGDHDITSIVRKTTMDLVLRPHEAIVWRWGHLTPPKYHGRADIKIWGPRSAGGQVWGAPAERRICNGTWEYRPDFSRETWRSGAESIQEVRFADGKLIASGETTGISVWKMRSPYVFVGGHLEISGSGARTSLSFDGDKWHAVGENLDPLFPTQGPARYEYWLKCELPAGAWLGSLTIINDLQMAPLALPGMRLGVNQFTYRDECLGPRTIRITHEWVERSLTRPPAAPLAPVLPSDGQRTDGTDIVFQWTPAVDPDGDAVVDYHFELSDRADMAWPLSSNFEKLISRTTDRGHARYTLPDAGLLTPGATYYWHIRAQDARGVWGPWSKTWSVTAGGPAYPLDVALERTPADTLWLRWRPNPLGVKPVKYRVYGSDEKGFSVSDAPSRRTVGISQDVPALAPANFVAEVTENELQVGGPGLELPNANKAFYRVVAVDEKGKRSGPSDMAESPRPFIYSRPSDSARVGAEYRYEVTAIRSIGDLRYQWVDEKETPSYWDVERPRFALVQGPSWLRIDETTGLLRGVPDVAGTADVIVRVTLERSIRRLAESPTRPWNLGFGKDSTIAITTEELGSATQKLQITVTP